MKRMRILGLALVAMFAMGIAASSASAATVLTLETAKGPVEKGANLVASSSNLIFVTTAGNLECTSNVLTGVAEINKAAKDTGKITEESSTGEEAGKACKTTTGLGPAVIESSGFPWPTTFSTKGENQVKGTKKVTFKSTFPAAGGAVCIFESAKVVSHFPVSKVAQALTLTTTEQIFTKSKKGSNAACPASGKLSGTFSVTSATETVLDHI
jgi:hypothetical protein